LVHVHIRSRSGPNRLPTSATRSPATCSAKCVKEQRVSWTCPPCGDRAPTIAAHVLVLHLALGQPEALPTSSFTRLHPPPLPPALCVSPTCSPISVEHGHHHCRPLPRAASMDEHRGRAVLQAEPHRGRVRVWETPAPLPRRWRRPRPRSWISPSLGLQ